MLSEQSAATVRATLPAVGAAIGEITERFYAGLFAAHPDLLRDVFNRGNQAAGTQRQALAGSIAAFATRLVEHTPERPQAPGLPQDRPDAMLTRIAHKHASLGIAPEQYAVVHEHLFAAIADVLGEAVTPEVAAAWDEVYWLMANALIAIERRLYEESGRPPGPGVSGRSWNASRRPRTSSRSPCVRATAPRCGTSARASTSPSARGSPTAPARSGSTASAAHRGRTNAGSASSA